MILIVKLEPSHLLELLSQPGLELVRETTLPFMHHLCDQANSYAAVNAYGQIVAAAGLIQYWEGRAEGWAIFAPTIGKDLFGLHRKVVKFLDKHGPARVEAAVDLNFKRGHQWMRMLGFNLEAPEMKNYRQGHTYSLYARTKE